MKVKIYEDIYDCTKAEKGSDYVRLYYEDTCILYCSGISDFTGYEVIDGEWSSPEPSDKERIAELELLLSALIRGDTE